MKTFVLSLVMLVFSAFVFSPSALAVNVFSKTCGSAAAGKTEVCSEVTSHQNKNEALIILKDVISVISYIVGVAAVIVIIVAAFQFVVAGGDQQAITNARNNLIYALVGVAVAALAQVIVVFVLNNVS